MSDGWLRGDAMFTALALRGGLQEGDWVIPGPLVTERRPNYPLEKGSRALIGRTCRLEYVPAVQGFIARETPVGWGIYVDANTIEAWRPGELG